MAKKCSACSKKAAVGGFEDAPYTEIASAIVAGYAAGYVDKMLVTNPDGTAKTTGMLVENPPARAALFIAAGVALTAYMKDEMSKGAGIGLATYGGYQLIDYYMQQNAAANGVNYVYANNQNINGNNPGLKIPGHNSPGSYGYAQSNINSVENQRILDKAKAYDKIVNNQAKIYEDVSKKETLIRV